MIQQTMFIKDYVCIYIRQTKQNSQPQYVLDNTMCKENTNNVNKDMSLRTTGGRDEQNINVFMYTFRCLSNKR